MRLECSFIGECWLLIGGIASKYRWLIIGWYALVKQLALSR